MRFRPHLRVGTVVALVALGVAVVPAPVVRFVDEFRVDREPLSFRSVSQDDPIAEESVPDSTTPDSTTPDDAAPGTTAPAPLAADVASAVAEVEPFVTIGVAFDEAPDGPVSVRWRDGDGWSAWQELEIEVDKGPDAASAEAVRAESHRAELGNEVVTEPLWVGDADAYQVRLAAADAPGARADAGAAPEAVLVRPDGQHAVVDTAPFTAGAQSVGRPPIRTRAEWSARAPANSVESASSLRLSVVHHSATGNDYSPAQVPGIIRSIQAFHMDSNGWSDIGYNFIVDKFGVVWEGRDGSLTRNSIGAHAEGFNTGSVGVVALGNTSTGAATDPQIGAIVETIAWKFASNSVNPETTVAFTSGGSSTIPAGTVVNLPRVVGHRDIGSTDCPGSSLYAALASKIRPRLPAVVAAKASPIGVLDVVAGGPRSILVSGWTFDPLVVDPIEVHVYVDGVGRNIGPTNIERPDLATAFPGSGTRHGFSTLITNVDAGTHGVCVFGINTGPGSNTLIECRVIVVPTGEPLGAVDRVVAAPDGVIALAGWTLDPDQAAASEVHVYVDGRGYNLGPAAGSRPDIGLAFPAYGPNHGFSWSAGGFAPGGHDVCVFAINVGPGQNRILDCRRVTVPGGPPVGAVDHVRGLPDGVVAVSGWTLDPDTAASNPVHVYVDGQGYNLGPANGNRPDIAAAFPGYGPAHGFDWNGGRAAPGLHNVCVFGIDVVGGSNRLLRCQGIAVPGGSPFGSIDSITGSAGRVGVSGWVIDPDVTRSVEAHVYIDGVGYNTGPAAGNRPDVAGAVPGYGPAHGISWLSPALAAGSHNVCVYGINAGVGGNSLLGCRTVTV